MHWKDVLKTVYFIFDVPGQFGDIWLMRMKTSKFTILLSWIVHVQRHLLLWCQNDVPGTFHWYHPFLHLRHRFLQHGVALVTMSTAAASSVRRKFSWGGYIHWHRVVICIWCALIVTSQFHVIILFPNQRFGEVC